MTLANMALMFSLNESTISANFERFVPIIRRAMNTCIYFPTQEEIKSNLPRRFKYDFPNVRAILDCTEIAIGDVGAMCINCKASTYCNGKNTVKFLVCTTPAALISFVSVAYSGKSSDKFIFNSEQLINKFAKGDAIIVPGKGFAIHQEIEEYGLALIRPTVTKGSRQFDELVKIPKVNGARVYVERVIQRIKEYSIVKDEIEHNIVPYITDIFFIIAAATNLSSPVIAANEF